MGREGCADDKYPERLEGKKRTRPTHIGQISTIQGYDPTRSVGN
jgi:hypothetical protein